MVSRAANVEFIILFPYHLTRVERPLLLITVIHASTGTFTRNAVEVNRVQLTLRCKNECCL